MRASVGIFHPGDEDLGVREALGVLEPANIAVLVEMRKQRPDGAVIALLMRRFIYTAGITGLMQVATLIIMTRVATQ